MGIELFSLLHIRKMSVCKLILRTTSLDNNLFLSDAFGVLVHQFIADMYHYKQYTNTSILMYYLLLDLAQLYIYIVKVF